jgi:uncharacterized repeat protein (TIGR03803 family)
MTNALLHQHTFPSGHALAERASFTQDAWGRPRVMQTQMARRYSWRAGFVALLLLAAPVRSQTLEVLHEFHMDPGHRLTSVEGSHPTGGLICGSDGVLYGATRFGGNLSIGDGLGYGTFYKLTPGGTFQVVTNFGADGVGGSGKIIEAQDGAFYGVSGSTNNPNYGCVFKITKEGVVTRLALFNGNNGADPRGLLVQAPDGNFYGTTYQGGANNPGTIFKMTPKGELTTLVTFDPFTQGYRPESGLTLGPDGNFYGTCEQGGNKSEGTIFKMTPQGEITVLVHLANNAINGIRPYGGLTIASDGLLYGTTRQGGTSANSQTLGAGTVFKMTLGGIFQTCHSFKRADGASPQSALIEVPNSGLYGATTDGGASSNGTIFHLSLAGNLTPLISFGGTNGASPAGLTLGTDGNLYGVTYAGGTNDVGTIFRVVLPTLSATLDQDRAVISWPTNQVGLKLQFALAVDSLNWTDYPAAPVIVNNRFLVTNTMAAPRFFRLAK